MRPSPKASGPQTLDDGRLHFLDIARGLAIVFLVCQHVQLPLGVPILVASHLLALGYARLAAGWRGRRRVPRVRTGARRGC